MKNLDKLPQIARLAKKFETKLIDAEFLGDGLTFRYEKKALNKSYKNADTAIEEEITRLERLLAVEL